MKFITYTDVDNFEQFFDPTTVKFTMSTPLGTMETGEPADGWGCKVCLGDHIYIIAKEDPASLIARVKEANGV
tara:strand:+ start:2257 stop:2475 length:219 start_codon:yes stop_codon:yes gene_type:complete